MLEYIILGFLMYGDMSGYDLKHWMTNSTSYFYDASFGSIYPALKRLVQKDMATFEVSTGGSKYKKIYKINDNGRAYFLDWLREPMVFEITKQEHLIRIFFYEYLSKETAIANLKAFLKQIEPVAEKLTREKDEVPLKFDLNEVFYGYATMVYGVDYFRFLMGWCSDLIQELETNPKAARRKSLQREGMDHEQEKR